MTPQHEAPETIAVVKRTGDTDNEPVPESRRTRFLEWPRGRVPRSLRRVGRRGIAAAREELSHHEAWHPPEPPTDRS